MVKKVKITIEVDGQKSVFVADNLNLHQNRDVETRYEPGDPKPKFKPGDSTMILVVFRPEMVMGECVPVPTIEQAFGLEKTPTDRNEAADHAQRNLATPEHAQAIEKSRKDMVSKNQLADGENRIID
jgi:hypothetical protein